MPTQRTRPPGPSTIPTTTTSHSRSPSPQPETPHEAVSRRVPTRPWTQKDEAHRLSLHHLTYTDARFNPPPPAAWKRLALVGLCVVLVWVAFSARLGLWERKREAGRVARRGYRGRERGGYGEGQGGGGREGEGGERGVWEKLGVVRDEV